MEEEGGGGQGTTGWRGADTAVCSLKFILFPPGQSRCTSQNSSHLGVGSGLNS